MLWTARVVSRVCVSKPVIWPAVLLLVRRRHWQTLSCIFLVLSNLVFFRPLMGHLNHAIKRTKALLLLFPDDVMVSIKVLNDRLREYSKTTR